jgi:hypothetical protein
MSGEDGGQEDPNGDDARGGGIFVSNPAIVSLVDCHILANTVTGGNGASPNEGDGGKGGHAFGAGIANLGTLNLTRCVLADNSVVPGAGGPATGGSSGQNGDGYGGALYSEGPAHITNCTFYGNTSVRTSQGGGQNAGAGIYNSGGAFTLIACTLSANTLNGTGGQGAALYDIDPTSMIRHSTISGHDSGIYLSGGNIGNTIVAGNSGGDLSGNMLSSDYNLFGATDGASISGSIAHTLVSQDPMLGPLADNGGPTPTMALLPGSPAIDRGTSFGSTTDERGRPRPFDITGLANIADGTDIGAFELIVPKLSLSRQGPNAWVSWSNADPSYWLESTTSIGLPGVWLPVANSPSNSGSHFIVTEPLLNQKFYRLRNQ